MTFQALNYKGNNFLNLTNDDNSYTKPTYMKDNAQLKHFEYFSTLYVQASRAITNYAPIGEYWLRFFPRKPFECLCRLYLIKSR